MTPQLIAHPVPFLDRFKSEETIVKSTSNYERVHYMSGSEERGDLGLHRFQQLFDPTSELLHQLQTAFPLEQNFSYHLLEFSNTTNQTMHVDKHSDRRPATLVLNFVITAGSNPNITKTHLFVDKFNYHYEVCVPENSWCCFDTRMTHSVTDIEPMCTRRIVTIGLFQYSYFDYLRMRKNILSLG